jgi:hypothetical protein
MKLQNTSVHDTTAVGLKMSAICFVLNLTGELNDHYRYFWIRFTRARRKLSQVLIPDLSSLSRHSEIPCDAELQIVIIRSSPHSGLAHKQAHTYLRYLTCSTSVRKSHAD